MWTSGNPGREQETPHSAAVWALSLGKFTHGRWQMARFVGLDVSQKLNGRIREDVLTRTSPPSSSHTAIFMANGTTPFRPINKRLEAVILANPFVAARTRIDRPRDPTVPVVKGRSAAGRSNSAVKT
jgi:hypothetical protein